MLRESWKSRIGFALAAMGSAIGLASILRFPYLVANHGGASFIFVYLLSLVVLGIPILISEVALGKISQKNCYGTFASKGGRFWKASGIWVLLTALLVSAFYSALSGWIFGYLIEAFSGRLGPLHTPDLALIHWKDLLHSPLWGLGYHFLFLGLSVALVYTGLRKGIERSCKILMPILLATLLILVVKGLTLPNSKEALVYLFRPDWSQITPSVILMALGQSFFTLSLGQGTMITYGSYLPQNSRFMGSCLAVAASVAVISILAAIAVFTTVFSSGITPENGLGLLFQTLPVVFSNMAGGHILGISFFLLTALAALTSEISALEPIIAYLVDERGWSRKKASLGAGAAAFLIGVPCALSTSLLSHWTVLGKNILELFDVIATTILVPIGGILGVFLLVWRLGIQESLGEPARKRALYLKFCLKYMAPTLILMIFLSNLYLLS